jgi:hypothetical protein
MLSELFNFPNEKEFNRVFRSAIQEHLDKYPYDFDIDEIINFNEWIKQDFPSIHIFDEWVMICQEFERLHKKEIQNFQELKNEYYDKVCDNKKKHMRFTEEEDKKLRRDLKIRYELPVHDRYFDYLSSVLDVPQIGFEAVFADLTENYMHSIPDMYHIYRHVVYNNRPVFRY